MAKDKPTQTIYSFKDVNGAVVAGGAFFVEGKPTHLVLSIERARELMGNKKVDEILKQPTISISVS